MTFAQLKLMMMQIASLTGQGAGKYTLLAAKDMEGRMKQRIFNRGKNAKGGNIGKYKSKWWMKQRTEGGKYSKGGRQINYVDLENNSDLRDSIQTVSEGRQAVLAIIDSDGLQMDKAKGQELIQGKKAGGGPMAIFTSSTAEDKAVTEYVNDLINEDVDKILNLFK